MSLFELTRERVIRAPIIPATGNPHRSWIATGQDGPPQYQAAARRPWNTSAIAGAAHRPR
jgi:hypothetical protein